VDSRTALRGSFVSRYAVAIALIVAAAMLGLTGAVVLRQVLPAAPARAASSTLQFVSGPAWGDSDRRHGTQSAGGVEVSPAAYRPPSDRRGGPQE
jgi:hypothetical protein